MTVTSPRRARLLTGATLLLAPLLVLTTPGVANAAPTRDRADAAAGWLGRQLDPDSHLATTTFDGTEYPDYGLTADIVLALDSAKVGRRAARQATGALRRNVLTYTGGGDPAEHYAGAYAKLLLVAAAQGADVTAFGGGPRKDLVAGLRALECGTSTRKDCVAADKGRFSDITQYDDFSNTIGHALALIGLERATSRGVSPAAVTFLLGQQCSNGGFPDTFGAESCVGSVDATGFAVQALTTVGGPTATQAAGEAGRWLTRRQHDNGSFTGNGVRNTNSTALAAQALTALGRDKASAAARGFLRDLQVLCGGKPADRGLIRYARKDRADAVRATSQAVPALARATLADISADGSRRSLPTLAC